MKAERDEFIYLIASGSGHYKIGRTINVSSRLATLQTSCPLPLSLVHSFMCSEASKVESALHKRFKHRRLQGEWFALGNKELEFFVGLNSDSLFFLSQEEIEAEAVELADNAAYWIELTTPIWGEL